MFSFRSNTPRRSPWPSWFKGHCFGVRCYNTLRCKVLYNQSHFTRCHHEAPSGAPPDRDGDDTWDAGEVIGQAFAPPVQAWWTALDGSAHHSEVDLARLFAAQRTLHATVDAMGVDILMEINHRTVRVHMRVLQLDSLRRTAAGVRGRRQVEAWSRTY